MIDAQVLALRLCPETLSLFRCFGFCVARIFKLGFRSKKIRSPLSGERNRIGTNNIAGRHESAARILIMTPMLSML